MKNTILEIRPRHMLCVLGFNNTWYDEVTIRRFEEIQNTIANNHHVIIKLTYGCDMICKSCSYHLQSTCRKFKYSNDIYKERDTTICKLVGLSLNTQYRAEYIIQRITGIIRYKDTLANVCLDCDYNKQCKFYISLK